MSELKPCPFCGGEAKFVHIFENPEKCMVSCQECDGWIGAVFANEEAAAEAWNRRAQPDITGETSDGYHTFNELYHHRAVLFSVICNSRPDIAWRAKRHHDGTMYNGMFIVGINTPDGQATYHYDVEPYWEMFRVPELLQAPEWDGHTPAQAIERIGKLSAQSANELLTRDYAEEAPATDVAEVVHCGDCKFRCDFTDGHCECRRWPNMPMSYQRVDPQFDFCSYGEKMESEGST